MNLSDRVITVAARDSKLSRAQVEEVLLELRGRDPRIFFEVTWMETMGDLDQTTSLLSQEKTDFFTKELDLAVVEGRCEIAIHSAKDLPDPLMSGLFIAAYTKGVDPSDVLVFREGENLSSLPFQAKVGTSSLRRQKNLLSLRGDLCPIDIRGKVERRLSLLDEGEVDALIMAKAALIRLKIERSYQLLEGEVSPMQGRLAIVTRDDNQEMKDLFSFLQQGKELLV